MINVEIKSESTIKLELLENLKCGRVISTYNALTVQGGLPYDMFVNAEELPNKMGCEAITDCFVRGLIANIHYAHNGGFLNDAAHLRSIISRLEEGFVSLGTLYKMDTDKNTGEVTKGAKINP